MVLTKTNISKILNTLAILLIIFRSEKNSILVSKCFHEILIFDIMSFI